MEKLNVKVGDKVIIQGRWNEESIHTVEKITPTGLIKVCGYTFYDNGTQRGGDSWSSFRLIEATPEAIQRIKDRKTVRKAISMCRKVDTDKIDIDTANKLIALLEGKVEV